MKNTNTTNFKNESEPNTQDFLPVKGSLRAPFAAKLSLMQFSPKANFNLLSTENTTANNNTNSPFRITKRVNSMQINSQNQNVLSSQDSSTYMNFNSENNNLMNTNYNLSNTNNNSNFTNDQKFIKSKFKNQSELSVSLNLLRGKSLKQSEFRNSLHQLSLNKNPKLNQNKNLNLSNIKNFSSTAANLNSNKNMKNVKIDFTQNPFAKFFKKPLSFRVDEFEEINQIENDAVNKQNKAYAQQRFFGNTVSEANMAFRHKSPNALKDAENSGNQSSYFDLSLKYFRNKIKKNPNLDDIEQVTLVNNKEELIKKYILPEIKNLTNDERKKLNKYDVHDKTERFVINSGHAIFLADLLKGDLNSLAHSSLIKTRKSPEKAYDPRKTEIDVSETKYGMYPKFLMQTSPFVRYIDSSAHKNKQDTEKAENEDYKGNNFSKILVPKKLSFQNTFNPNDNKHENFHTNNNSNNNRHNENSNTEESLNYAANAKHTPQIQNSSSSVKHQLYIDTGHIKPKTTKNSINSLNGFNYSISNNNNFSNKNNSIDRNPGGPLLNANLNQFRNSSQSITHYHSNNKAVKENFTATNNFIKNSNKGVSATCYISNQGYEINANREAQSLSRKNNRLVVLDYPEIKFPIQPYKRLNRKAKKDKNYLTNGSMVHNPYVIQKVKEFNEQVVSNFQNEKDVHITNEMSDNIDKLNVIEKKINKLIVTSKESMKDNKEYRKFNSNSSIVILK